MPTLKSLAGRFANSVDGPGETPSQPTAADIDAKLTTAQVELDALIPEHALAAFQAVSHVEGAADREESLGRQIDALRRILDGLRHALAVAREREEAEFNRVRAENLAALQSRVSKIVHKRTVAVAEIEAGIAQAAKGFRKLHELNMRVRAAFPWGSQLGGTLLTDADMQRALAVEVFRQTAGASTEPAWPGAVCPDERVRGRPDAIASLASVIEAANAHAISIMESGKVVPIVSAASATQDDGETSNG